MFFSVCFMTWPMLIDLLSYIESKNFNSETFHFELSLLLKVASFERCRWFRMIVLAALICNTVCIVCIEFNIVFYSFRDTINDVSSFDSVVVLFDALKDSASDALKDSTVERLMMSVALNDFCLRSKNLMSNSESIDINRSNFDARSNRLFNENLFEIISTKSKEFFEKTLIKSSCIWSLKLR